MKTKNRKEIFMQIHRVKEGETLYSIAREYGVSPRKTAEINGLKNPDRLAVGRELLILFPRKSYTARRTDTLESISRRFSVEKSEIIKNNPTLSGLEKIYPEEILCLSYCDQRRSTALTEGYIYKGTPKERISRALPYLSSLCLSSEVIEGGRLRSAFNFGRSEIENLGKRCALRVYCPDKYSETDFSSELLNMLIRKADSLGVCDITISARRAMENKGFVNFLSELKNTAEKTTISLECDGKIPEEIARIADRLIITDSNNQNPDFYREISENFGANRIMLDISPFASVDERPMPIDEALSLADEKGAMLTENESDRALLGSLYGKKIRIPSMKKTKAKLDLIGELGLLGACIDIMRCPVSTIMMLSALYETNPGYFSAGM